MRSIVALLTLVGLASCDLTQLGAYGCDEYCDQMISRAVTCAEEEGASFDDWAGTAKGDVKAACDDEIADQEMTEVECQAETATVNNMTCDQLLSTVQTFLR